MVEIYLTSVFGFYVAAIYLCVLIYRRYHHRLCLSIDRNGWDWANQMRLAIILGFGFAMGMNVATWGMAEWVRLCAASPFIPLVSEKAPSTCRAIYPWIEGVARTLQPLAMAILLPAGLLLVAATYEVHRRVWRDVKVCAALVVIGWAVAYLLLG